MGKHSKIKVLPVRAALAAAERASQYGLAAVAVREGGRVSRVQFVYYDDDDDVGPRSAICYVGDPMGSAEVDVRPRDLLTVGAGLALAMDCGLTVDVHPEMLARLMYDSAVREEAQSAIAAATRRSWDRYTDWLRQQI